MFNILLQVLDDGHLTDTKGRQVDFRNTVIIMTSNVGAQELRKINVSLDSVVHLKDKIMKQFVEL